MKGAKSIIIAVILIAIVGGYYYYVSNLGKSEEEIAVTAVQNVLLRNLENDYPPTPRELIKYYSDIIKCLYNEKYSDEQLAQLADKALALYDEELAANNPRDQYITSLKTDVKTFTDQNYTIVEYSLPSSVDINEYVEDGRQCASLYCIYSVKTGGVDYVSSKQIFILRKEKGTGHWKIFGFDIVNSSVKSTSNRLQQRLLCGEVLSFTREKRKGQRFSKMYEEQIWTSKKMC